MLPYCRGRRGQPPDSTAPVTWKEEMDHDANIRNVDPHAECASRANNVKLVRALANARRIEETARLQFGDRLGADHAAALRDQIAADRLILHMTDITLAEVRRQLTDDVGEAAIAVKNARRHFGRWKKRLPKIGLQDVPDFDRRLSQQLHLKNFQRAASKKIGVRSTMLQLTSQASGQKSWLRMASLRRHSSRPYSVQMPSPQ